MNQDELDAILQKHKLWLDDADGGIRADLKGANLRGANLRGAGLWGAVLRGADLRGADLDYSCFPLWCGSKGMIVDRRIAAQIAAHFCALECDDADYIAAREAILEFAQTSHRAKVLGLEVVESLCRGK